MIFNINYCELPVFGSYFEPLNTISNLFFIISAIFLYYFYKKNNIKDVKSKIFLFLVILISLGSFLWHLNESDITFFLDVIPVTLFFIIYLYFLIFNIIKNNKNRIYVLLISSVSIVLLWIIFRSFFKESFIVINEAYGYVLTLFLFMILLVYSYIKKKDIFKKIVIVFLLFLSAYIFRQADLFICPYFVFGTHFIWHIINAFVSYFAVKSLY